MAKPQPLAFSVHPSVVYQLGESLISDSVQALIELVKNCYDADASYAKVTISTSGNNAIANSFFSEYEGYIIIEDDGFGMGEKEFREGWLTISNRQKRRLKDAKETTPGGRTPLGDKGLGRLGVQRLGTNVEIIAKKADSSGVHFGFSWTDFQSAKDLEDVRIQSSGIDLKNKSGTRIVVSDLREPDTWKGRALDRLTNELSRMISPYKEIRDFQIYVEVDGRKLELVEFRDEIRNLSPTRYEIRFDGEIFSVAGKVRLEHFRPDQGERAEEFASMVEYDGGKELRNYLMKHKRTRDLNLVPSKTAKWFLDFHFKKSLSDVDQIETEVNTLSIANPGTFRGEVNAYKLGDAAFKGQHVFDLIKEYRRHVKESSGIRVYRDGFAIRVDQDWLKLGAQWTSAKSYYGLKPENTLGYIALSARENIALEEKTDREGFMDSPYYRNFYSLLQEFVTFSARVQDAFGRVYVEFCNERRERIADVDTRKTVEELSAAIKVRLSDASEKQENLRQLHARLEKSVSSSEKVASSIRNSGEVTGKTKQKLLDSIDGLTPLIGEALALLKPTQEYLSELSLLESTAVIIDDRVNSMRRQMDDMYEAIAVGLTAEALAHEIANIADSLADRAKSAQSRLRTLEIRDRILSSFVEHVHSSARAMRKQLTFLSPGLRFVREKREVLVLEDVLGEMREFYEERLSRAKIEIEIHPQNPFAIRMNRGKFAQIIDNFVLNSEYWLKNQTERKTLRHGNLTIEISRPFIRIFDNGKGIEQSLESTLFEPFVTAKARGVGRGLGLFIVRQLLNSEGCSVDLLPKRNRRNRLYIFQIDLRGALHD